MATRNPDRRSRARRGRRGARTDLHGQGDGGAARGRTLRTPREQTRPLSTDAEHRAARPAGPRGTWIALPSSVQADRSTHVTERVRRFGGALSHALLDPSCRAFVI